MGLSFNLHRVFNSLTTDSRLLPAWKLREPSISSAFLGKHLERNFVGLHESNKLSVDFQLIGEWNEEMAFLQEF